MRFSLDRLAPQGGLCQFASPVVDAAALFWKHVPRRRVAYEPSADEQSDALKTPLPGTCSVDAGPYGPTRTA